MLSSTGCLHYYFPITHSFLSTVGQSAAFAAHGCVTSLSVGWRSCFRWNLWMNVLVFPYSLIECNILIKCQLKYVHIQIIHLAFKFTKIFIFIQFFSGYLAIIFYIATQNIIIILVLALILNWRLSGVWQTFCKRKIITDPRAGWKIYVRGVWVMCTTLSQSLRVRAPTYNLLLSASYFSLFIIIVVVVRALASCLSVVYEAARGNHKMCEKYT